MKVESKVTTIIPAPVSGLVSARIDDVGAAFFPFSSDAHQLHDPDHVASAPTGKRA
jgi:hypothetical protein